MTSHLRPQHELAHVLYLGEMERISRFTPRFWKAGKELDSALLYLAGRGKYTSRDPSQHPQETPLATGGADPVIKHRKCRIKGSPLGLGARDHDRLQAEEART